MPLEPGGQPAELALGAVICVPGASLSWRGGYCQTLPVTTDFLRTVTKIPVDYQPLLTYLEKIFFLSIKVELYSFKVFTFLLITFFFLLLFGCTPVFIAKGIYY